MKLLKTLFLISVSVLIIWIDLPENLNINFKLAKQKINFKINPLSLDLDILGIKIKRDFRTHLGLDLKGGSHLVFEADTSIVKPEDLVDSLNSARDVIEKRVNFFGVAEPVVQTIKTENKYRINVDLPGVSSVDEAINLIGKTAQLSFKEEAPSSNPEATSSSIYTRLTKDTGLTGKDIKKASLSFDSRTGKPQVALNFTQKGADLFAKVTQRNLNKPVAIYLDYFILSAPTVQSVISDGNAVISGNFTVDEAKKLAISINSGALPLPIKLVEQRNIGPTLGASEVKKSVSAGLIGLVMVLLFMILYYQKLGLIASLALIIYGLISLAIFRGLPVVLTLPGIAGFILSIGMAVDSNILIFERIKEEQRAGKDFDIAVNLGFGRAIDAIKDANVTTLLVAFILFNPLNWEFLPQFGMVRGFALTLAIGVATSLFTGVVITKRLINAFYKEVKN
ncbi:protein translocase subunit SecD [Candidatus Roizmanbacteria bacterium CG02_land_8_20_14_3_00_36_15]|uniref:Protein translocase subunit SecD n=1 Tax=Candidatus Roizmanbacteria bacterium CG10_big_fil_rev_8_21_14_0_10_36_26 TaxID=1974851 RepID=A0A2M8KLM9_9BACT|nr:MAG: protein translocase subunit SecD [Candidatus Roizmanbacteria bacterium CG03_land_8_20_14_0_80_36_21]PIV37938.1 MAG: protein translocase subunit SecD [Candidatus Roizmanbacteria bacterium CG02_land_8_20_14_3_00_36_15]PIY69908.1 MAG: protein translocase subunit SecD [Candidatus Roizmanbacteria bacterium CG_4_10_14_0_8_um_filter_36_36]PJE60825.1 MAG: protein translocase subunit SecD [Candidatus Roizmanbacteria bacterium CG10_big_fil_rev_8_21_14_0_10_36_26]